MAGVAICIPVTKPNPRKKCKDRAKEIKYADHQTDANPAPSAREETAGREEESEEGEEIGGKENRFNQKFQHQENSCKDAPEKYATEKVVRRGPEAKSKA